MNACATPTSAVIAAVTVALAALSVGSGSGWSIATMLAVLVRGPGCVTSTVSSSTAGALTSRSPTVQTPVVALYSAAGFAETNTSPGGSTSLTRTPVAGLGPRLTTATWKVSGSPTATVERVATLRTLRFADAPALSVTLALSFAVFGSASTCCVFSALLTSPPSASTVATMTRVAESSAASAPTVQAGAV